MNGSRTQHQHLRPGSSTNVGARILWCAIAALALGLLGADVSRAAGTFYVDNSDTTCSNNGPGTEAQPFCTIAAALVKQGGPGTTILVKSGIYQEQVTVAVSGASGSPLVIRALGFVTIEGADTLSQAALWTQFSGDVWSTPIGWKPLQVNVNGELLMASTADPALLPPGTFRYVVGEGLYVNVGGGNPGDQNILVGHRLNGFHLNGKSWITIEGFSILHCDEKGIELENGASNCEIRNNVVMQCASSGVSLLGCADVLIEGNHISRNAFHGIELRGGSTGCRIVDNVTSWNADAQGAVATGIYLNGSPDNRIDRNRTFHNADSGVEIQNGSDNCVSTQNLCYGNGDHGFEHLFSVGTVNVGNVAWGNHTDGFSIEGQALNTSVYDCIATDNGLAIGGFDFFADTSSTPGMASDYNIFWNSTSQKPIKFRGVQYATMAAYSAASGLDGNSLQADPLFLDPSVGLFHIGSGSPAIDSGTSGVSNWPATDAQGLPREDDPTVPNTGAGAIVYADRGAFEYRVTLVGVGDPPAAPDLSLSGAFPNPCRGSVAFALQLPRGSRVEWGIFDLQGRKLGGGEGWRPAGRSLLSWSEPKGASGGVRFARVVVEGRALQRRFVTIP